MRGKAAVVYSFPSFLYSSSYCVLANLPPRSHGTTFNVSDFPEHTQKSPIRAHIITSRDGFGLISLDWKIPIFAVPAAELASDELKAVLISSPWVHVHPGRYK
jgi:hypothetical protein